MNLDELCQVLRDSGLITALIYDALHEKFIFYFLGSATQKACLARPDVLAALKQHQGELGVLIRKNDVAMCMAPDADRASYRYITEDDMWKPYFRCDTCATLRKKFELAYSYLPYRDPSTLKSLDLPE